jgi:predicted transcriptional regulator
VTWAERYKDAGEYTPVDFEKFSIWYWEEKGRFVFEITKGEDGRIVHGRTVLGDVSRPSVQEKFKRELKSLFALKGREGEEKAKEMVREIIAEYRQWQSTPAPASEKEEADYLLEHDALDLLESREILECIDCALERGIKVPGKDKVRFVCGEKGKRLHVWLALFSAKTPYPQFTVVVGPSGSGKTNMIETALLLLPDGIVKRRGYITGAGIRYGEEEDDKLLYMQEYRDGADQDIRLLSPYDDGFYAEIAVRDKETGEMTTVTYDVKCRGFITSTADRLPSDQMLRRMTIISTDFSEDLTRKVNKRKAEYRSGKGSITPPEEVEKIKKAVELLEPREVVIPFASEVVEAAPWDRSTLDRLFDLVCIIANLYQKQRPKREDGRIVALPWDLAKALEIAEETLKETISYLPKAHLKLLQAIVSLSDDSNLPTAKRLVKATGIPQKTVYNYCRDLITLGYITGTDERPKRYEPTEKGLNFCPRSLRENISWPDVEKKTVEYLESCCPKFPKTREKYEKYIITSTFWEKRTNESRQDTSSDRRVEGESRSLKEIGQNTSLDEEAGERHRSLLIFIRGTCKGERRSYVTIDELQIWAVDNGIPFEVLDRDLAFLKSQGRLYNPRGPETWGVV